MTECYKLTYAGLTAAISSSVPQPKRLLLLSILADNGQGNVDLEQLSTCSGMGVDVVVSTINTLLQDGSLSKTVAEPVQLNNIIITPAELIAQLESLSINGKIILTDAYGLVLASSGYSQSDSEYIGAIATNLVQISERAKARIKNRSENTLWYTGLSWGDLRGLCLSIYVGGRQYILVVGGIPNLEKSQFFDVVGFLVRRYGYG